jgi:chemotaxis protein MotD
LPKANVVRQEAHLPPTVPSALPARSVAAVAGGKVGTGSEAKGNESAAHIETGLMAAETSASGSVPPPTQQIANRITGEISAFEVVDRIQAEPSQATAKPILKVLQIQLQPAELGTVSIRMELREGGLVLHVEAAKAETAEIIRSDKDALSNLLRSSGYNVDASSIRVVDGDRTAASQQTGQQGAQTNMHSSAQPQHGGAERNARGDRGAGGSSGGDPSAQANRTDIHEPDTSRAGGGLYI